MKYSIQIIAYNTYNVITNYEIFMYYIEYYIFK